MLTTKSNQCRVTRDQIDEIALGEQPGPAALAHIAGCADCREFRDQRLLLRELAASLQPVTAPADFDARLRARLATQPAGGVWGFPFGNLKFGKPALAFAATIVVFVGALFLMNQLGLFRSKPADNPVVAKDSQPVTPKPATIGSPEPGTNSAVTSGTDVGPSRGTGVNDRERLAINKGSLSVPQKVRMPKSTVNVANGGADILVRGARPISQGDFLGTEISLSTPTGPLTLSLQDGQGVTRTVSLPPVTFGAQVSDARFVSQPRKSDTNPIW